MREIAIVGVETYPIWYDKLKKKYGAKEVYKQQKLDCKQAKTDVEY